jgi:hypothetical protein
MTFPSLDTLPGFRRRFRVTPARDRVRAEVEDDYHHMVVVVHHQSGIATAIEPTMVRAPWTTCPGAIEQLRRTFTQIPLSAFAARGERPTNCTHLHDLAMLAAAHADDAAQLVYDVLVSDPVEGRRYAELRRNGVADLRWSLDGFQIAEPAELAGMTLDKLGKWMDGLEPAGREAARILRWGAIIAHGRAIPIERQSDASRFPANCHTFQPENAVRARRVGEIRDFSAGPEQPLEPRQALEANP